MKKRTPAGRSPGSTIEIELGHALAAAQALRALLSVPMRPLAAYRLAQYSSMLDPALAAYEVARKNQLEAHKVEGRYPGAPGHPKTVEFDNAMGVLLKQKQRISVPAKKVKLADMGLDGQQVTPGMFLGLDWLIEE